MEPAPPVFGARWISVIANTILIASQMHLDNMASRPVQIERPTSPFPEPLGLHDLMTDVLYCMSGKTQAHMAMTGRHMFHFIEQYRKGQDDPAPLTPGRGSTEQPDDREDSLSPRPQASRVELHSWSPDISFGYDD